MLMKLFIKGTVCNCVIFIVKRLVHPKMKILSVITHPHVVPTP